MLTQSFLEKLPFRKTGKSFNRAIIYLFLVMLVFAVYAQLSTHAFNDFDDSLYIFDNSYVLDGFTWEGIRWAFTNVDAANWHPLTWLSHMADREIFHSHTGGYILENALWHAVIGCLVFSFFSRMTKHTWMGLFIAAVFILHPTNVETVAWASQRKSLLSAFFWFAALIAYLNYVEKPTLKNYSYVALAFFLGLLSKAAGVSLPIILVMMDVWPLKRVAFLNDQADSPLGAPPPMTAWKCLVEKIPFIVLAGLVSAATFWAQREIGAVVSVENMPIGQRIANSLIGYKEYLHLYFWPAKLCVFYPHMEITRLNEALTATLLVGISIAALLLRKQAPWFLFGWLWFGVILIPMIGLVQVGSQAYADRYLYLPGIGLSLVVCYALKSLLENRSTRQIAFSTIAIIAVLPTLGIKAHNQVKFWKTGETLFDHAIDIEGPTTTMVTNLGISYLRDEKYQDALDCFKAIPESFRADMTAGNIASAYLSMGRIKEGIEMMEKACSLNSSNMGFHACLALTYKQQNEIEKALRHYDAAYKLLPTKTRDASLSRQLCVAGVRAARPDFDKLRTTKVTALSK
jgi:tetratricopeptide (TPR) repeat protein